MLTMKKGKTIYQFLQKALEDLRSDFLELRSARFQITKKRQKLLKFFCEIDWSNLCLQQFDKGVSSKPSGDYILGPDFCLLS